MRWSIHPLEKKFIDCVRTNCKKSDCKLNLMRDFPDRKIILDVDCCITKQKQSSKICDYVVFAKDGNFVFILPIEFKSFCLDITKIKEQLEGGISFFKRYLPQQFECYPLLVSRRLGKEAGRRLSREKINYRGKKTRIKHIPCNSRLSWDTIKKSLVQKF